MKRPEPAMKRAPRATDKKPVQHDKGQFRCADMTGYGTRYDNGIVLGVALSMVLDMVLRMVLPR